MEYSRDYDRKRAYEKREPAEPQSVNRLTQAAIALLIALLTIYLVR